MRMNEQRKNNNGTKRNRTKTEETTKQKTKQKEKKKNTIQTIQNERRIRTNSIKLIASSHIKNNQDNSNQKHQY